MGYAIFGIGLLTASIVGVCVSAEGLPQQGPNAVFFWTIAVVGSACATVGAARIDHAWVFWAALGLRALTWWGGPVLSDDIYRYVHEGRATRAGLAVPYTVPPSQISPAPNDGISALVNHPEVTAAYPPFTQELLWGLVALGDGVASPTLAIRLLWLLLDFWLLRFLWRRRKRRPFAFGFYAFHVLPLLEAHLELHLDIVGAVLGFAAWTHRYRARRAGVLGGLAAGVKPVAPLVLIALARTPGRLRQAALFCALAFGVTAAPYLVQGVPLMDGLRAYGTRWQANSTLYALVEQAVAPPFVQRQAQGKWTHLHVSTAPFGIWLEEGHRTLFSLGSPRQVEEPWLLDQTWLARMLCAAVFLLTCIALVFGVSSTGKRVLGAWMAFWLLTPTLYPWYLLWVLPFGAWFGSAAIWLACASAPLLHQPVFARASDGVWHEAMWPRVIFLLSLGVGALWDWHRAQKNRARQSGHRAPTPPRQRTPS